MGLSADKLAKIIEKTRNSGLMQDDRSLNTIREQNGTEYFNGTQVDDSMYLCEAAMTEGQSAPVRKQDFSYSKDSALNSKMPSAIRESMLSNVIDIPEASVSVTDRLNIKPMQRKQQIREDVVSPSQQVGGVDYSVIKAIVNECLANYFEKNNLNEQATLKTIGLSEGKIRLVDNKGNVFAADLKHKGNINDKK